MIRAGAQTGAFRLRFVRFVLAFFSAFVALGYLAAISHMAFVAHAACAEHGKLVHVQESRGPSALPPRQGAATVTSSDAVGSDEHEHCVIGIARTGDARVDSAAASLVPHEAPATVAPLVVSARSPAEPRLGRPIAILFLSPKSSPPV